MQEKIDSNYQLPVASCQQSAQSSIQIPDTSFQMPESFARSKDRRIQMWAVLPLFEERGTVLNI